MSRLEAKVILMFALLGAALAFRAPSEAEANGLSAEMESDESELAIQQDTAELMLTYMKMAEEHANLLQFRHEVMKMGFFCDPCKTAVGYLLDIVKSDNTKASNGAKDRLRSKCNSLSFLYKTGCNYVLDNYFDRLWNYLSEQANADYVCRKVTAC
ncbi:hypothetical protein EMCRGX_G029202 [Ephydatia muelleri]|eukprot:Em0013g588a